MPTPGKFIVFEGIDGSGKSTQARLFADRLFDTSKYNHVLLTREPYDSEISPQIREILTTDKDPYLQAQHLAGLFIEDRGAHIEELVLPTLEKGVHVICDRYLPSTVAYQSTQGMDIEELIDTQSHFPIPDLTYFISVPSEIALKRAIESGSNEAKFENTPFQRKLVVQYEKTLRELQDKHKWRIRQIPGNHSIEKIQEKVWNTFTSTFPNLVS